MIYKVTARLPGGNLSVEVEGESRYQCLNLAQHYFRRAFCEDLADNDIWWKEVTDTVNAREFLEYVKRHLVENGGHIGRWEIRFEYLEEWLREMEAKEQPL